VVLDQPYLEVDDETLKSLRSLLTMVNGRVVHASGPFADLQE
jgi:predicted amidohydrolase YtcJ